jgi:nucleoside-diphosphate-sugar epimerase
VKILVTGITGFIGQRLLSCISDTDQVFVICRKPLSGLPANVSVVLGDLNEPAKLFEKLKGIRPEVCIHLAWQGIPDFGFDMSQLNLNQSSALWRYLVEECGCSKIISTGSCWEYGKSFGVCREDDKTSTDSYFTWAKHSLADFGAVLAAKYKMTFIWTRIFYAYGPGQRDGSLIPMMAQALKNNEKPMIKTPSNANDFIQVDDIAAALAMFTQKNVPTGVYNLGSGQSVPVWKVCEHLEEAMGRKPLYAKQLHELEVKPMADFWADMSKSTQVLDWHLKINIQEGIRRYVKSMEIKV